MQVSWLEKLPAAGWLYKVRLSSWWIVYGQSRKQWPGMLYGTLSTVSILLYSTDGTEGGGVWAVQLESCRPSPPLSFPFLGPKAGVRLINSAQRSSSGQLYVGSMYLHMILYSTFARLTVAFTIHSAHGQD